MKSKALKSVILIALVCLSMGAFAQQVLYTTVLFERVPNHDPYPNQPHDVLVTVTWYLQGGGSITNFTHCGHINVNDYVSVPFPGTMLEASQVINTKIVLSFYGNSGGTSKTFPGFVAIATYSRDFTGISWWKLAAPGGMESKMGIGEYIFVQEPTP